MPDKEGSDDEKKSTKSVVNKKQKQFMNQEEYTTEMVRKIKKKISARTVFPRVTQNKVRGEILKGDDLKIDNKNPVKKKKQKDYFDEEGYDIARDEGRVRPSKDKKDATTMPPSKEMKKTQKVNKGPSALERVKADIEKKYGKGAIMNVKKKETKEELDLTQVAEAFGGYIIEAPIDAEGNIIPKRGESKKIKKKISKIEKEITSPKPGEIAKAEKMMSGKIVQGNLFGGEDESGKKTRKKRSDAGQKRGRSRRRYVSDNPRQLQIDLTNPEDRKQVRQDVAKVVKDPVKKALVPTLRTAAKGAKATLAKAIQNPIGTAIVAGVARDSFRNPLPQLQMPTVKGGKVGKRTAG